MNDSTDLPVSPVPVLPSGQVYLDPIRRSEWVFSAIRFPLEVLAAGLLWWYRDIFVR